MDNDIEIFHILEREVTQFGATIILQYLDNQHPVGVQLRPQYLHPRSLTWNSIMEVWKMMLLCKRVIFGFHVNFPRCS